MSLKSYLNFFEALANEKRLEIYEFVLTNYFVSKSELAIEMDLNRASLNHHLDYLKNAQLVKEIELIIEGKRQYFLFILKVLNTTEMSKDALDGIKALNILEKLQYHVFTYESWQDIRQRFSDMDPEFVQAIETRLFKHISKIGTTCTVCNKKTSISACKSCLASMCKNCQHLI